MSARAELARNLLEAEDRRTHPYTDTVGKVTIGVGWNLTDRGLPEHMLNELFGLSMMEAEEIAERTFRDVFPLLTDSQRAALAELAFNLGEPRLRSFKRFRARMLERDWPGAQVELLDSKWAQQVKRRRAQRIAKMIGGA